MRNELAVARKRHSTPIRAVEGRKDRWHAHEMTMTHDLDADQAKPAAAYL
jgi:hypothetical protein